MLKYLINDIEFEDISGQFKAMIVREDGFNNSEQILREKTNSELSIYENVYKYVCALRKDNYCDTIDIKVLIKCGDNYEVLFLGTVRQTDIKLNLFQKTGTFKSIKDNSFSALIANYQNTEINLYNTNTINCEPIEIVKTTLFNNPFSSNGFVLTTIDNCFDILDVFKYIIGFITDNKVSVVSDYLTANKICIATGYALHNEVGTLDKLYPSVSLQELFNEVRKKTTLYAIIEQDSLGNPVYRIEDENYSYGSNLLLEFTNLPQGYKEILDDKNIYNEIKVGSSNTESEDDIVVPQVDLTAWNEENYIGCGCVGLKDNTLDLVSDWIIDGNVIYEACRTPIGTDYDKDSDIYMFAIEPSIVPPFYQIQGYDTQQFNTFMNNENVLNRWLGIANSCIALSRTSKYGFLIIENGNIIVSADAYGSSIVFTSDINNIVRYSNPLMPIYDYENSLNDQPIPDAFTYFLCQEIGNYTFRASAIYKQFPTGIFGDTDVIGADLYLSIEAWSGIGGVQIDYQEFVVNNAPNLNTNEVQMKLEASFGLSVGNIVFVRYRMVYSGVGPKQWNIGSINNQFTLLSDSFSCEDIEDNLTNFKPFVGEFEYPLCYSQYKEIKEDKRGIIKIKGTDTWVKEVEFNPKGLSTIKVKYKDSLCDC